MTELEKQYKWQKEAVERRQKEVNDMYDRLNSLLSAIAARSAEVKGQVEIAQDWLKELKMRSRSLASIRLASASMLVLWYTAQNSLKKTIKMSRIGEQRPLD